MLDVADRLTFTVTPGARRPARGRRRRRAPAGVPARVPDRLVRGRRRRRRGAAAAARAAPRRERYREALARLEPLGGDLLGLFREPARDGRVELLASAATHAVLPLLATRGGAPAADRRRPALAPPALRRAARLLAARVRLRAGARAAARRARARATSAPTRAPTSRRSTALAPVAAGAGDGRVHDRLGGGPVAVVARRLSVRPRRSPTFTASRCAARARGRSAASPTTPTAGRARARASSAGSSPPRPPRGSSAIAPSAAAPGLIVFAIDTELLGHWWWEGPAWLEEVIGAARRARRRAGHPRRGARAPSGRGARRCARSSWGEGKDLRTWDSPEVADLAWAARRLELRAAARAAVGRRPAPPPSAPRASCSRCRRATGRSSTGAARPATTRGSAPPTTLEALLEAINSGDRPPTPRLRNLAPDLSLTPLLEP